MDKVNTHLRTILNVNQWRNTQNVIEWFGNIEQKSRHSFISFDMVDFYPSISENLLDQALSWASSLADISHEDISIIKHPRKSLLSTTENRGLKAITCSNLFDVTMGSYDGAEKQEKNFTKLSNKFGLKITAESNLRVVNFLDVIFDLAFHQEI